MNAGNDFGPLTERQRKAGIRMSKIAPIAAMLQAAETTTRFHMPGHKGQLSMADTTELRRTDNLYSPVSAIREAEKLAAKSCGAADTLLLTGGATAGLHAMILSTLPRGSKMILPRNAHHSVLSACAFQDIDAVFTKISIEDIAEGIMDAIDAHPDAKAVLVTRPDYYGNCADLSIIAAKAAHHGMLLLVDEAHGAHFPWWNTPQSASKYGAAAWVQSAHKTLPALTGAAFLHIGNGIDSGRARRFLRMAQTSSPPFPILESLDNARAWMDENGTRALLDLKKMIGAFVERLSALGGYHVVSNGDPTRLVIDTRGRGLTGFEAQALLESQRVDVEMADESRLVLICTVSDSRKSFSRLYNALAFIPWRDALPPPPGEKPFTPGERVLSLRRAMLSAHQLVPPEKSVGRVAAAGAGLYPPGVPFVLPGERITEACIEKILSLPDTRLFGVERGCLVCVLE